MKQDLLLADKINTEKSHSESSNFENENEDKIMPLAKKANLSILESVLIKFDRMI